MGIVDNNRSLTITPDEWKDSTLPAVERYYNNNDELLKKNLWKIRQEFGTKGKRWWWNSVAVYNNYTQTPEWRVRFVFKCAHDAVLFQLKY